MAGELPIGLDDVRQAARRVAGLAHRTPVLTSHHLDEHTGASLYLKAEHLQPVGAFKIRGAANAIAALDPAVRARGVVAGSSGNHAQAVALAARSFGVPATLVMPTDAPEVKLAATREHGAEVVLYDRYAQDRDILAAELAGARDASLIPPFDHPQVMAGQGTVALELLDQVPDLDLLVVPVGGGGLLAGCAVAARALRPDIEVVGVEPAGRPAAREAIATGMVTPVTVPRTSLDGQQTSAVGHLVLPVLRTLVDRVVGVTDAEAERAVALLATRAKQVVEPSGASAVGAVLAGTIEVTGRRVGVVLSGGNLDPATLVRILHDHG